MECGESFDGASPGRGRPAPSLTQAYGGLRVLLLHGVGCRPRLQRERERGMKKRGDEMWVGA